MVSLTILSCCMSAVLIAKTPHLLINQSANKAIDQKIEIRVEGLEPFQAAEIYAKAEDRQGVFWNSHATFQADAHGVIDVSSSSPFEGSSYTSADSMGLFWSMLPPSGDDTMSFNCKDDTFLAEVDLVVDKHSLEKQTIVRYLKTPEVQKKDIRENGLVGSFFIPKSDGPLPVIITLSGSNGGLGESRAKLLASNGFAVLALGYFGIDGLPSHLQEIPLEYFEGAFAWLKNQPEVDSSLVGIYGVSRGAELALLLGSVFPNEVSAIVAVVPSSVVYGGLSETPVNAWLYKGTPIAPFAPVPQANFSNGKGESAENPGSTLVQFLDGMKDANAFAKAAIPVEKIRCPILLISGGDDHMWPSEMYSTQIINRLKEKGSKIGALHLNYPNAGHGIHIPNLPTPGPAYYHPIGKLWLSMGGSRKADAKASRESWDHLVAFFHHTLVNRETVSSTNTQETCAHLKNFNLPIDHYPMIATPSAVIFDFGGVLTGEPNREAIVNFIQHSFHLSKEEFEKVNQEKRQAVQQGKTDEEFWISYAKTQGITLPSEWGESFRSVMKNAIGVNSQMYVLVNQLKEQHIPVGLLSNIDERLSKLIRDFGLYEPFNPCLLSCEIGIAKPDLKAYELLLTELNLPAKEVLFIDDRPENIEAAQARGFDAILFQSEQQLREELCKRGVI